MREDAPHHRPLGDEPDAARRAAAARAYLDLHRQPECGDASPRERVIDVRCAEMEFARPHDPVPPGTPTGSDRD